MIYDGQEQDFTRVVTVADSTAPVLIVSGEADPVRAELDRSNIRAALSLGQLTAAAIHQACFGGDGPLGARDK